MAFHTQIFTTAGATTWTCPAGVTSVVVRGACGGGGGGGGAGSALNSVQQSGGGGGGGARVHLAVRTVIPGTTYSLTIGAGGNGGTGGSTGSNGNPGSAGGATSAAFAVPFICRAPGGGLGGFYTSYPYAGGGYSEGAYVAGVGYFATDPIYPTDAMRGGFGRFQGGGSLYQYRSGGASSVRPGGQSAETGPTVTYAGGAGGCGGAGEYDDGTTNAYLGGSQTTGAANVGQGSNTTGNYLCMGGGGGSAGGGSGAARVGGLGGNGGSGFIELSWNQ